MFDLLPILLENHLFDHSVFARDNCYGQKQASKYQNTHDHHCNQAAVCLLNSCKVFILAIDTDGRQISFRIHRLLIFAKFLFAANISLIPASVNHMVTVKVLTIGHLILTACKGVLFCKCPKHFAQFSLRIYLLWCWGNKFFSRDVSTQRL